MASYAIQRRRGTAAEHGSFTGLAGELTVNTTRNTVHVHDGSTAGGHETLKTDLSNLGTTALNASLLVDTDNAYDLGSGSAGLRNVFISGNLTVSGTTTTVDTTNTAVKDTLLELNSGVSGANSADVGLFINRGSSANVSFIWDESADEFAFATTSGEDGTTSGNVTIDSYANIHANVATLTATAARYADLAEMYASDEEIEAGTIVHFAGEGKVAPCPKENCKSVAGIVSTDPAHLMNADQEGVALALAGRVPCKVTGIVNAGDLMVSAGNGMAMANNDASVGTIIGKAIEANDGGEGVIEVVAMMM